MTIDFRQIVTEVVDEPPPNYETRICPDQYVGEIGAMLKLKKFADCLSSSSRPEKPAVLLILESPHTSEFKDKVGPAKGVTGTNIAKCLTFVPGLENVLDSSLILMNAVQYQCSLGKMTSEHRDKVFKAVWERGGKEDFLQRLRGAFRRGDIIVCACTQGNRSKGAGELRQLVHRVIAQEFPEATILRRTHPAKWNMPSRRNFQWDVLA